MGSIAGSVGDKFGARIPNTGTLVSGTSYVLTSVYLPVYPAADATHIYLYVGFEYGWRAFTFQGVGGAAAQVNVTNDGPTASGVVGATAWAALPVGSTGTGGTGIWTNPLTAAMPLIFASSGPWAAFQIVPSASGGYINFGAAG